MNIIYFNFLKLIGSYPVDVNLIRLIEQTAADGVELEKELDIYDSCSRKTGPGDILILKNN